jgi:hypothetical protein
VTSENPAVERAVAACVTSAASPAAVSQLRRLIEAPLVDRLTIISDDRNVVLRSIDETFERLSVAMRTGISINWLHWIVATAMALASEDTKQVHWLDCAAPDGVQGTPHERRITVFRVILLLDGHCQWRLLRCVAHPGNMASAEACHEELSRRLRAIAG